MCDCVESLWIMCDCVDCVDCVDKELIGNIDGIHFPRNVLKARTAQM